MNQDAPLAMPGSEVMDLVRRFPLPLAVLQLNGQVSFVNERFTARFSDQTLESPALRSIISRSEQVWHELELLSRDCTPVHVLAQSTRVAGHLLVLLDDTGGREFASEVEQLRHRIAELERMNSTDFLTGAWNRAHLDRMVQAEIARSQRYRHPLSLVLFDIDHFKKINDTAGHQTGDLVLRELVKTVQSGMRMSDLLFRWGGEEFVVLAPATGYRHAESLATGLRVMIAKHRFPVVGEVTVSVGVAEAVDGETCDEWFARTDAALYEAKRQGRNRVVVDPRGNSDTWAATGQNSTLRLVWQEGYECGDPLIDEQHRELFNLANALIEASMRRGGDRQSREAALERLLDHVGRHFGDEERRLGEIGYPYLCAHKLAHRELLLKAATLHSQALAGGLHLGTLVEFIAGDVVAKHIFATDIDFFPLMRAHQQAGTAVASRSPAEPR